MTTKYNRPVKSGKHAKSYFDLTPKQKKRMIDHAATDTNYCSKHDLYHGLKYKSCTPLKSGNTLSTRQQHVNIYHDTSRGKKWEAGLRKHLMEVYNVAASIDDRSDVDCLIDEAIYQIKTYRQQTLKKRLEELYCKGELGCPRCGNLGICGSKINDAISKVIESIKEGK